MTEKDELRRISEIIETLEHESREVDSLIERLNRKKEEIKNILEAMEKYTEKTKNSSSGKVDLGNMAKILSDSDGTVNVSTGNFKLDSLLYGGVPAPSNIVVRGPPFSGKYIIENSFIAQSVKDGIPSIVLTVDKDVGQMKKSISRIAGLDGAEEDGLVKFIDAYSTFIQTKPGSKYAVQADSSNLSLLIKTVDSVTEDVLKKHDRYRFILSSLTTFMTSNEESKFLRFLQQFSQKRRSEGSVSFYMLEDGLFEEKMYEAVSYMMDGAIHLRKTFSESYLRVEGIGKARSRDWIEMYPSDGGFDLGSFTLERVR